jgi:hypothetical protein
MNNEAAIGLIAVFHRAYLNDLTFAPVSQFAGRTTPIPIGLVPNGSYASHECDRTITVTLRSI